MASVTSAPEKTNGIADKSASNGAESSKPVVEQVAGNVDEEEFESAGEEDEEVDEEEDDFEVDDEEERQVVGDEDDEDDLEEEVEGQEGQVQPDSLTHFLIPDPQGQETVEEEIDEEDAYIPPAPEPMSRKRSIQEVTEGDDEPDSKKAKA